MTDHEAALGEILARAHRLDHGGMLELSVRPSLDEEETLDAARLAARTIVERRGLGSVLDRFKGELIAWAMVDHQRPDPSMPRFDTFGADLRRQVLQPIADAGLAALAGPSLDPADGAALSERWLRAAGADEA